MQLNRQSDYALRILLFLALQPAYEQSTLDEISAKFVIVRNHLTKIVAQLAKLGYIHTLRGKGGGIKLTDKGRQENLYNVIAHFEPTFQPIDCYGLACPIAGACHLENILDEASSAYIQVLAKYQVADLVPHEQSRQQLMRAKLSIKHQGILK